MPAKEKLQLVWEQIKQKEYQAAQKLLHQFNQDDCDDHWYLAYARCHQGLGAHREALRCLDQIKQPTRSDLICRARTLEALGLSDEVRECYHSIPGWRKDKTVILSLGHYYETTGNYRLALQTFRLLPLSAYDTKVYLSLARCHELMRNFDEAMRTYRQVPDVYQDEEFIVSKARCYELRQQYDKALATYSIISEAHLKKKTIISKARCLQAIGQFDEAIRLFKLIAHWERDKEARLGLARCFFVMGKMDEAIQEYKQIPSWRKDKEALLGLVRCYEEKESFKAAFAMFALISPLHQKDKFVLISKSRCFEVQGRFKEAVATLQEALDWETDPLILTSLGRCYEVNKYFDEALRAFKRIPNWRNNQQAIIGIARCLQGCGRYQEAIETFKLFKQWATTEAILLGLGHCYESMGSHKQAWQYYVAAKNHFPYSQASYPNCLRYAIRMRLPMVKQLIEIGIRKWPFLNKLYSLRAAFEYQENRRDASTACLHETIQHFPYYMQGYIDLIRQHLFHHHIEEAQKWLDFCNQRFKGNIRFIHRIQRLIDAAFIISHWREYYTVDDPEVRRVHLPPFLLSMMQDLAQQTHEKPYLVGSTILKLLDHQPIDSAADIDIVLPATCVKGLLEMGFSRSRYNPQLYLARYEETSRVECFLVPHPKDAIHYPVALRDFTITSFYCDQKKIYDPTGRGFIDYQLKQLRTVLPPTQAFEEDPIRVLRAIKYIVAGYSPTIDLKEALLSWIPQPTLNCAHFFATLRKYLSQLNKLEFVKTLQTYQLIEKIVNISDQASKAALQQLEAEINGTLAAAMPPQPTHNSMLKFFNTGMQTRVSEVSYADSLRLFPRFADKHENKATHRNIEALDLARPIRSK